MPSSLEDDKALLSYILEKAEEKSLKKISNLMQTEDKISSKTNKILYLSKVKISNKREI